jgi:simple sugar transport system permease protein
MKNSFIKTYDFFLILLLAVFAITVGLINPAFFSIGTLFDVIRNQTVYILLAFALLPVVILGGFDISFVAIAALATFPAILILTNLGYEGGIWLFYAIAIVFGIMAGLLNGWLIWAFKLAIFDFSLGMASVIFGLLALFSGYSDTSGQIKALVGWNKQWLVTVQSVAGESGLHISFILIIITFIGMYSFLRCTTMGRYIYAMGSDKSVAIRTGIDSKKIFLIVFSIMGAMAAVAGATNTGLGFGNAVFAGKFMRVFATVIIGGASIRGGKGSVFGTLLGVILVGMINQALVYLRIPTAWMDALLGAAIIVFAFYQTLETKTNK